MLYDKNEKLLGKDATIQRYHCTIVEGKETAALQVRAA